MSPQAIERIIERDKAGREIRVIERPLSVAEAYAVESLARIKAFLRTLVGDADVSCYTPDGVDTKAAGLALADHLAKDPALCARVREVLVMAVVGPKGYIGARRHAATSLPGRRAFPLPMVEVPSRPSRIVKEVIRRDAAGRPDAVVQTETNGATWAP